MHRVHAGGGRDREAVGHGQAEPRHLGEAGALAAEQLTRHLRRVGEGVDVADRSCGAGLDELDDAHRGLFDREVRDVEHGAAEAPLHGVGLVELLVDAVELGVAVARVRAGQVAACAGRGSAPGARPRS